MSADNYWLSTNHPTFGVITIMAFASDDATDLEKMQHAVSIDRFRVFPDEDALDEFVSDPQNWTEYGDSWVDWKPHLRLV